MSDSTSLRKNGNSYTLKVLLLSSSIEPTAGWGKVTYELCRQLWTRNDISFDLHIPVDALVDERLPFRSHVYNVLPPWTGTFAKDPRRLFRLICRRLTARYDLVHAIVEFPYAILAYSTGKRLKAPYVISVHGTYAVAPFKPRLSDPSSCQISKVMRQVENTFFRPRFDVWPYRLALREATFVTAPSRFTAEAMTHASGIHRAVEIVHNAVDFERFQKPLDTHRIRQSYGISKNARIVLSVGGLKRRKGLDVLMRAFKMIADSELQAHLVIVGDGEERVRLLELARSLGIVERLSMPGFIPEDDLVGFYQTCDVYVHLPRNYNWMFEGFGIVYLEAGACGKPVVGTRSGGVADAVIDGRTGFLVKEDDYKSAGEAIRRCLQDRKLSRRMGEAGRLYAAQHTWEWYAETIVTLYWKAMELRSNSSGSGLDKISLRV
jgi:glycosyltransferase involved in cell wall biosynthesis